MTPKFFNPFIGNMNIPKTVYKFRDWENQDHKKLLDGELYFSSPLDFNDPFDCNISIAYHKLQNNPELQKEYFTSFVERSMPKLNPSQKEMEVNQLIKEGRFNDPDWLEWQAEINRIQYGERFGVFCLTKNKDNILLWSHYANSHQGFCLGFNSEKFFYECLQLGIGGGDVYYDTKYPEIDPTTDLSTQLIMQKNTKSDLWIKEEEYRLTKPNAAKKIFIVSTKCFSEINLGCNMKEEIRKQIIEFVKANIPSLPIYQAKTIRNKFELKFEQIA